MGKTVVKKQTTKKQTKANRANAKKSTGPRTAEGKARVRHNSVTHGLRTEDVVVRGGPTAEDPAEFSSLLGSMLNDCKPKGALERVLVERLTVSYWRLRRAYRFEARAIEQANKPNPMSEMLEELSQLPVNKPGPQELPGLRSLDKLVRYEMMIDRELLRTAAQLQHLQHVRKQEEEDADPEPGPSRSGRSADPRGSGPQPEGCGSADSEGPQPEGCGSKREAAGATPAGVAAGVSAGRCAGALNAKAGCATALEQCPGRTRTPLKSGGTRAPRWGPRQIPRKLSGRAKPFGPKREACTGLRVRRCPLRAASRHPRRGGGAWRDGYDTSPVSLIRDPHEEP